MKPKRLGGILERFPSLAIGLLGDFFLDRYLDLDEGLTERSLETGLPAYQVVRIRNYPGAGGTVAGNLCALGVGRVIPITVMGMDEHGYALRKELETLGLPLGLVFESEAILTPTYTKPILYDGTGAPGRELNRLDVKNRTPLPEELEAKVTAAVRESWPRLDALIVADQVEERDCGVITGKVRELLAELGGRHAAKPILVDSRRRIGEFRKVMIKPNEHEARMLAEEKASGVGSAGMAELARKLELETGRPVFITRGEKGIFAFDGEEGWEIPAMPVEGPIDIVGAGDATTTGIVASLAAGATPAEAGTVGCLVASITIQQLGATGTASPEGVRKRLKEYLAKGLGPRRIRAGETVL